MQFLINVLDDKTGTGTADEMVAIDAFNEKLIARGHWVLAGGLADPSASTVIDNRGANPLITQGPFTESSEYAAGFWVIEAPGNDTAVALMTEGSKACNRRLEVRPLLEMP